MLMDQSVIAGIGNIYSDEILFTAKIRPDKLCNRLTSEELHTLSETIRERLAYFIDRNHITFEEYTIGKGKNYRNTPKAAAHALSAVGFCGVPPSAEEARCSANIAKRYKETYDLRCKNCRPYDS